MTTLSSDEETAQLRPLHTHSHYHGSGTECESGAASGEGDTVHFFMDEFGEEAIETLKGYYSKGQFQVKPQGVSANLDASLADGETKVRVEPFYNHDSGAGLLGTLAVPDIGACAGVSVVRHGWHEAALLWSHSIHEVCCELQSSWRYSLKYRCAHRAFAYQQELDEEEFQGYLSRNLSASLCVGGGFAMSRKTPATTLLGGIRFGNDRVTVSVITEALRRFETTVFAPVKLRGRDCSLACRAKCERGGTADICVGLEAPCMFVQGAMLRAKYSRKDGATLAYYKTFAENWKASLTWGQNSKLGFMISHE